MRIPVAERGPSPCRTLETLHSDHSQFMASGGKLKNAKQHNNAISSAFFSIPLTQVRIQDHMHSRSRLYSIQVCPPALHITLGVFFRLFTLFERDCHQLDLSGALIQSSDSASALESYATYAEALRRTHTLADKLDEQKRELTQLEQLVSFLTLQLPSAQVIEALHQQLVNKRNEIKELVRKNR